MNRTKIAIVLVAIAALTLSIVGLTAAQVAQYQPYANTTANSVATAPDIIFGIVSRMLGFGNSQSYAYPYVAPPATINISVPTPYQPYQPYQGG